MAEQSVVRGGLRLVRELVALHPLPFIVAVSGSAVYAGATVGSTVVLGRVTDRVLYPTFETGAVPDGSLPLAALAVLAVAALRISGVVTRRYFAGMTSERGQRTLRHRLTEKYLGLPLAWHHRTPTGRLLAHADNDTEVTTELLHPLPFSLGVVFLAIFSSISLLVIDLWLAIVAFLIFPALTALNQVYSRRVEEPSAEVQAAVGAVSSTAHESFDGALVVKTLGRAEAEGQRFALAANGLRSKRVAVGHIRAVFESIMDALPSIGIVLVVVFGSFRINSGAITRGDLVQVAALFTVLALPVRVLGFFLEMMPPSVVSRRRLQTVFTEPDPEPIAEPDTLPSGPLSLRVEGLGFSYRSPLATNAAAAATNGDAGFTPADELDAQLVGELDEELAEHLSRASNGWDGPVLTDVNLAIEPGEVVALVGSTGSGKSTLCHLVSGLIPPTSGHIAIGGVAIEHLTGEERTDAVALVFQESFLFADTLRANIDLMGTDDDELRWAASVAQVESFVADLPYGFDTIVGERGVTLSGGQRQRVALARALIRKPRLLLLDDATSAVDPKIEQRILTALRSSPGGAMEPPTSLIVAQRVSTIKLADRVIYLADGSVVGAGRHDELLANHSGYAALVRAYETAGQ